MDLDKSQLNDEVESRYVDCGSEESEEEKARSNKTLPSFIGEFDTKSEIRKVPTQYKSLPPALQIANLQAMLSTPIQVTLPLADVLKIKPDLWDGIARVFKQMGIKVPPQETLHRVKEKEQQNQGNCKPVPINKVGDYCEGEDGNTTLPVTFNGITTMAILDSGAGVAIATKQMWDAWGKPALRKTRMKLQLADGYVERPLGLLEKIVVSSCNIEYEHTFAVVDFWHKTKL